MKKGLTELVFILDRSGSMGGLESDTIGGFNSLIRKQQKQEGEALVNTILFDHSFMTLHDRVPLSEVRELTERDYQVGGTTALIDAIGRSVDHISEVHRYIRQEDVPEHVMFVIITDGYENASTQYSSNQVKKMIEAKKSLGWEFLFLGSNIDAVETASKFGIGADRAVDYHADSRGTKAVFSAVDRSMAMVRCSAKLSSDWKETVEEDYESRSVKGRGGKKRKS